MRFIGDVIRAFFRLIGLAFLAIGLAGWGFLAAVLLAGDGRMSQPLGQVWFQHDPFAGIIGTASLPLAQVSC